MIRILLAEDQAMVRGALTALLSLETDIEVLGAAADGEAAWRELQRLKPDLLVTDIEMPGLTGLELAQRIQRYALPVKVVIVTTFARDPRHRQCVEKRLRRRACAAFRNRRGAGGRSDSQDQSGRLFRR